MAIDYSARIERVLSATGLDVVAIVPGPNMFYFTGLHVHLSERPTIALLSRDGIGFIIPQLEVDKLNQRPDIAGERFVWSDAAGYQSAFQQAVRALGLDAPTVTLGVDGQTMRVFEWLGLGNAGARMGHARDVGRDLLMIRAYKTPAEIDLMRQAVELSETALQRTIEFAEVGMTERQIATRLDAELTALGTEGLAFGSLVLAGKNSALPHGVPGDNVLGANDFLLIDFGGKKGGYPADITRTFCLGEPTATMREIYAAVKRANEAAHAIAKPGMTCHEIDQAARQVIDAAGYGDYFTHRLGHGLGLSGHELPNIAPNDPTPLEVGMVFTIEPGIYHPEIGGVRIEDDVVVTEDGIESLSTFPKDL